MKGITMTNPVKKFKNIDGETKLAMYFGATYVAAAVTAVAAGAAVVYGAVKTVEAVQN